MAKRALKLPDGGTLDLPIPDGFGAPIFALNDAGAMLESPMAIYTIGIGLGLLGAWLFLRLRK
jgi:hypothetical protein